MTTSTIPRHFPTFATWFRGLLLAMGCVLARIVPMVELTDRVMVPATITLRTLVDFGSWRPPQPRGNCFNISPMADWGVLGVAPRNRLWRDRLFGIGDWKVCNMHAENFSEIVQRLQLRTVEVQPLEEGRSLFQVRCLITDPRIPRDWLLDQPCPRCFREPEAEDLLRRYPERFHLPAAP